MKFSAIISLLVVSSPALTAALSSYSRPTSRRLVNLPSASLSATNNKNKNDLNKIMSSSCIDQTYTVSLFTDSHLSLVLEPKHHASSDSSTTTNEESWCGETLVMEMEQTQKVIVTVEGEEYNTDDKPLLPLLDNISLRTLIHAFQQSETGLITMDDYDIINRNCATFVLDMMHELDIPADDRFMLYNIERFYQNDKIMESIKKSDKLEVTLNEIGSKSVTVDSSDEQLLALLVDQYVRNHQASKMVGAV